MNESILPANPEPEAAEQPSQIVEPAKAAAASKAVPVGETSQDTVRTMRDLKEKAPDVHRAMMEGIAQSIVRRMQAHGRRMKKLIRESSSR